MAWMHEQEESDSLQECGDVFFQQIHFVNEHEDRKHGE
jgi:hypothetical protein